MADPAENRTLPKRRKASLALASLRIGALPMHQLSQLVNWGNVAEFKSIAVLPWVDLPSDPTSTPAAPNSVSSVEVSAIPVQTAAAPGVDSTADESKTVDSPAIEVAASVAPPEATTDIAGETTVAKEVDTSVDTAHCSAAVPVASVAAGTDDTETAMGAGHSSQPLVTTADPQPSRAAPSAPLGSEVTEAEAAISEPVSKAELVDGSTNFEPPAIAVARETGRIEVIDKLANKTIDKPADTPADKSANKPANKPEDKAADKPADQATAKTSAAAALPTDESPKGPIGKSKTVVSANLTPAAAKSAAVANRTPLANSTNAASMAAAPVRIPEPPQRTAIAAQPMGEDAELADYVSKLERLVLELNMELGRQNAPASSGNTLEELAQRVIALNLENLALREQLHQTGIPTP